MAISSPFLPDDQPAELPEPARRFEQAMAAVPRGSLLGPPADFQTGSGPMADAQATRQGLAQPPLNTNASFVPRVTAQSIDRMLQEKLGDRDKTKAATHEEVQRRQNIDMLIVDQMQDQMTGEITRYAPLRESL